MIGGSFLNSVIQGIQGKSTIALGGALSAGMSFLSGQALTGNSGYALVLAAISAPIGAFLASGWAKIIDARRQARLTDSGIREGANTALFQRSQEEHRRQIEDMRRSSAIQARREVLLRTAKHKILNVMQHYEWHITELRYRLRDMGDKEIPDFTRWSILDLLEEEDKEMEKLTLASVKDTTRIIEDSK